MILGAFQVLGGIGTNKAPSAEATQPTFSFCNTSTSTTVAVSGNNYQNPLDFLAGLFNCTTTVTETETVTTQGTNTVSYTTTIPTTVTSTNTVSSTTTVPTTVTTTNTSTANTTVSATQTNTTTSTVGTTVTTTGTATVTTTTAITATLSCNIFFGYPFCFF